MLICAFRLRPLTSISEHAHSLFRLMGIPDGFLHARLIDALLRNRNEMIETVSWYRLKTNQNFILNQNVATMLSTFAFVIVFILPDLGTVSWERKEYGGCSRSAHRPVAAGVHVSVYPCSET